LDYLLGVDLGTAGCKTVLFDLAGNPVASSYADYPLYTLGQDRVEQDPEDWWRATCSNIRETLKQAKASPRDVVAVGCDGQFPDLVMVNNIGEPVRRAIIYSDMRGKKQTEQIFNIIGSEEVARVTGLPRSFFPGLPAAKILWVRENEPEHGKLTHAVLGAKDFLTFRMTGQTAVDYVEAWWTGLVRVADYSWSEKMLSELRIDQSWLANIRQPTDVMGEISQEASQQTGLARNTPVVCGSVDGMCNVVGSGITEPGTTMDVAGTTEIIASLSKSKLPPSIGESIFCWRHLDPQKWVVYTSTATAGACLRWFRDQFADAEKREAAHSGASTYDLLDREAAEAEAGSGKLLFLPYLAGEYTPFFDLNARGVFLGLTLDTRRKHFVRAILEGVAYSLNHVIESLEALGIETKQITVSGGGSRSRLWNQIKADVTGRALQSTRVLETGCLGAAILAGIGVGAYSGLQDAVSSTVSVGERFLPDNQKNHETYSALFRTYKETYDRLRDTFTRLSAS
jgi:xylulokinase